MSLINSELGLAIVRADTAEVVETPTTRMRLLADASATAGMFSTHRVSIREGADGAKPHYHRGSSELFYVVGGVVQILAGERVIAARPGDLVVAPPRLPHAFAAAPGTSAELLVVLSPAVERFEYLRHLALIAEGRLPPESIFEVQELYDNHFVESSAWNDARSMYIESRGGNGAHAPAE